MNRARKRMKQTANLSHGVSNGVKVALVHDWLNQKVGGAEKVLLKLAELYPQAPIYTLVYNGEKFDKLLDSSRIRTSPLQRLPGWLKQRTRYLLPLIPKAIES